jgi:pimeloyl-ACP methyl ester carboxylesterase
MKRAVVFACALAAAAPVWADESTGFELPQRPYKVDQEELKFQPLPGAKAITGMTAQGSAYRLEMPDKWNGDIVIWVRGGAQYPQERLCNEKGEYCVLPSAGYPSNRDHLIKRGFAWASPTYREYRITPKVRTLDALDTLDDVRKAYPGVKRAFIVGHSLGGQTVQHALELFPKAFAGGLAGCTGDAAGYGDFYQFTLAAMGLTAPDVPDVAAFLKDMKFPIDMKRIAEVGPKAVAALGPDFPYERNAKGDAVIQILRDLSGGDRPMFNAGFFAAGVDTMPGYIIRMVGVDSGARSFIDNSKTEYRWESKAGAPMTAAEKQVNQTIPRFTCDPTVCTSKPITRTQTRNLGGIYKLTGKLQAPLLQINALGDMIAFYSGVERYAVSAEKAGSSKFLVQRAIRDERHCGFNKDEMNESFDDLVKWVDTGVKPDGDNTRDLKVIAAPDYGCKFTRGAHERDWNYDAACKK